jgi:flagellar biogenesis protein FliO
MNLALFLTLTCLSSPSSSTISASPGEPIVCADDDEACKERERKKLEAIDTTPNLGMSSEEAELPSLGYALFKMMVTLGAVCLLAYLSLGKLLPKLMRVQAPIAGRRILQVVDRLPIDTRRSIMIIKTGEDLYYLVGVTEHGINLLSRLDSDDVDAALATAQSPEPPSLGRFAQVLLGRSSKEG